MTPRRRHPQERGQAMVEFALTLPILLFVIFALIQFGLYFGKRLDLQSATREGARRASIAFDHADPIGETRAAVHDAVSLTDDDRVTVTVTPSPSPQWNHGDVVTVRSTTPYSFGVMGLLEWNGTIRSEAQVRVE